MQPKRTGGSPKPATPTPPISAAEWQKQARKLFGKNPFNWRFKCPACGHEQSAEDFRPYKDKGATPDSARFVCIGRFLTRSTSAFNKPGKGPCNYTALGLLDICPVHVVGLNGILFPSFAFATAAS